MQKTISGVSSEIIATQLNGVFDSIKCMLNVKIAVNEYENGYEELNLALYQMNKEKYERNRMPSPNPNFYDLTPGTQYHLTLGNRNFIRVDAAMVETSGYTHKMITLTIYGPNKVEIRAKILRKIEKVTNDKISISNFGRFGARSKYRISERDWGSIILPLETKKNIIAGLYGWWKSKDWYEEHYLVHKIGVLLYGDPGTGKSTITRAISSMFGNCPIMIVQPTDISDSLQQIISERQRTGGAMIVLFEDFDMFFYDRDKDEPEKVKEKENPNSLLVTTTPVQNTTMAEAQNLVFQMLDGSYSTEDTIYIATTNHIDRIDKAMIRHGRFDIQEEIKYFDKEMVMKFLKQFGYGEKFYQDHLKDEDLPIQPAKLQAMIMQYRSDKIMEARGGCKE